MSDEDTQRDHLSAGLGKLKSGKSTQNSSRVGKSHRRRAPSCFQRLEMVANLSGDHRSQIVGNCLDPTMSEGELTCEFHITEQKLEEGGTHLQS